MFMSTSKVTANLKDAELSTRNFGRSKIVEVRKTLLDTMQYSRYSLTK